MNRAFRLPHSLAATALVLALGACGSGQPDPSASPETAAAAAPDAKPGLSLSQGRLVLPAVKGNPGAAYFTLTNTGPKTATLAAVEITGAGMAMLHQTMQMDGHSSMQAMSDPQVPAGGTLVFAPGGSHVMVDAVPESWKPGGSTEITLTFSDGDKLSAPLTLAAPGGE